MKKINFQDKKDVLNFAIDYFDKHESTTFLCDFDLAKELRNEYEDYDGLDYCSVELHSDVDIYLVSVIGKAFIVEPYKEELDSECGNLIILNEFDDLLGKILVDEEIVIVGHEDEDKDEYNCKVQDDNKEFNFFELIYNMVNSHEQKIQELDNKIFKNDTEIKIINDKLEIAKACKYL